MEDLFVGIMKQNPGFTSLPVQVKTTDREVLLQQLKLLRDLKLLDKIIAEQGAAKQSAEYDDDDGDSGFTASNSRKSSDMPSQSKTSKTRIPGTILEKWEASSPYNFFLTRLPFEESSVGFAVSFGG